MHWGAVQMPLAEKMQRSKLVIDNSGSLEHLQEKVNTPAIGMSWWMAVTLSPQ